MLSDEQADFGWDRGTIEQIFILRNLTDQVLECQAPGSFQLPRFSAEKHRKPKYSRGREKHWN